MPAGILNLPIHIPWKLIAVSSDMMDTEFCNKRFPFAWRSSLAISAYEPKLEDLPAELCDERITYLKITCSITGYQPSREEIDQAHQDIREGIALGGLPVEELNRILEDQSYFACYGALLNVAVFPHVFLPNMQVDLKDYPHIIAIEPKLRDFYQAASESGEILTASDSSFKTDKSNTQIEGTESTVALGANVSVPIPSVPGAQAGWNASTSRRRHESEQDTWAVHTDASHERRETQGTTTQLSQMYNLLTGYHVGTNRATFLMLARPHVLQPTDHRTFIQGLRHIEGIQEFLVIVARPRDQGLCVEAFLETGHFREGEEVIDVPEAYDENQINFIATQTAEGGTGTWGYGHECKNIEDNPLNERMALPLGWVIDTRDNRKDEQRGDDGHPGILVAGDESNGQALSTLSNYNYQIKEGTDNVVTIAGTICGKGRSGWKPWNGPEDADFRRAYTVLTRSNLPKSASTESRVPIDNLLITSRGLCACLNSGEECVEVVPLPPIARDNGVIALGTSIVDETGIDLDSALLTPSMLAQTRMPAMREFLRKLEVAMITSGKNQRRRPFGEVGFLDSDYFKNQVKKVLPKSRLETRLTEVSGLPEVIVESLGREYTVAQALDLDLRGFGEKTGLSAREVVDARRVLIGIAPKRREGGRDEEKSE